jgi:hypothetical protein
VWGPRGSHPGIENFKLTAAHQQGLRLIEERMEAETAAAVPQTEQVKVGGFASLLPADPRTMRQNLSDESRKKIAAEVAKELKTDTAGVENRMRQAAGRLLLFRYLDFDVNPGAAYRYRVRLQLENPNRNRLLEEVADPNVKDGLFRWTEWSEPTVAAYVQPDTKYFVEEITPPRGRSLASAKFNVFQWMPASGSVVTSALKVDLGDFIGGTAQTEVLDPAQAKVTSQSVDFSTNDMLVDVMETPKIDPAEHSDLKIPTAARGRFDIPTQVLVVDEYGDLRAFDPVSRQEERASAEQRLQMERAQFQQEFADYEAEIEQNRLDKIEKEKNKRKKGRNTGEPEE